MRTLKLNMSIKVADTATDADIESLVTNFNNLMGYGYANGVLTDSIEHAEDVDLQGVPQFDWDYTVGPE